MIETETLQNIILRRYLSFERFLQTLNQGFFIPNASLFDDHWEAMIHHMDGYLEERNTAILLKDEKIPTLEEFCISDIYKHVHEGKQEVYVSCWNGTAYECVAMWKLYGKNQDSVMIETNASELISAFISYNMSENNEYFGCLKELKYVLPGEGNVPDGYPHLWSNDSQINSMQETYKFHQVFTGLQYKHKSYEFEKEYRFLIANKNRGELKEGLCIPISDTFIKKVILQPDSCDKFKEEVSENLKSHGFKGAVVEKSTIDELPKYE